MTEPVQKKIRGWIEDSIHLREKILQDTDFFLRNIEEAVNIITRCYENMGKLLLCGNGGSAADAQHLATEFMVRYQSQNNRKPLAAIALTTDTSNLTACANDFSFDDIFLRQLEGLANRGDVLIAISTSGNSPNIIKAVDKAAEMGVKIIKFLGGNGGKLKDLAGIALIVPALETSRIQEVHITIGHILCELLEERLFGF